MLTLTGADADEIELLLLEQSGVVTATQAINLVGRSAVRRNLAAARWRRVCRDILSVHNGPLTADQHLWVAVLVAGRNAALAGSTALSVAGVRGVRDKAVQVLIPAPRNRSTRLPEMPRDMPPVRVIRTRMLPPEHLQAGRPSRTTTARAAVDAAIWARTADDARAILAAVCQQGKATPNEIFEVLSVRRRLPRLRMIRATMLDIGGGAHSLPELDLLKLCRKFSLPEPDRQTPRLDAIGRRRYLDAYWSRWKLHVEVDGSHHMAAGQWTDDMLRQNDLSIKGVRILRFPASAIRYRPAQVARQLHTALEVQGWRP
jgi:hypothetical protein